MAFIRFSPHSSPLSCGEIKNIKATKEKRGDGLHQSDNAAMFKRAERNPIVVRMMAEYGEERCHELLHVSYRGE